MRKEVTHQGGFYLKLVRVQVGKRILQERAKLADVVESICDLEK